MSNKKKNRVWNMTRVKGRIDDHIHNLMNSQLRSIQRKLGDDRLSQEEVEAEIARIEASARARAIDNTVKKHAREPAKKNWPAAKTYIQTSLNRALETIAKARQDHGIAAPAAEQAAVEIVEKSDVQASIEQLAISMASGPAEHLNELAEQLVEHSSNIVAMPVQLNSASNSATSGSQKQGYTEIRVINALTGLANDVVAAAISRQATKQANSAAALQLELVSQVKADLSEDQQRELDELQIEHEQAILEEEEVVSPIIDALVEIGPIADEILEPQEGELNIDEELVADKYNHLIRMCEKTGELCARYRTAAKKSITWSERVGNFFASCLKFITLGKVDIRPAVYRHMAMAKTAQLASEQILEDEQFLKVAIVFPGELDVLEADITKLIVDTADKARTEVTKLSDGIKKDNLSEFSKELDSLKEESQEMLEVVNDGMSIR